jgi:uncharacterized protein
MAANVLVLRLKPGMDLRGALEAAGVRAGCVVSAVGSLSRAVLRYAAAEQGAVVEGPLELLTLSGTLSADGVHLHASVSDAQGGVRGGHLMPGCVVRTTAEVVIAVLDDWELRREEDAATGYRELIARRSG